MPIIDFVLKHWYLVVILYIVLSSILRSVRPAQSGRGSTAPGRPAKGMPPFGGGGMGWPGRSAEPRMSKASPSPRREAPSAKPSPSPAMKAAPTAESVQTAAAGHGHEERLKVSAQPSERSKPAAGAGTSPGLLNPEDASRGVLWAEILGPPRAKRPYRR
ncbi:hypothetical protein LJK88_19470 [Paenibacillus sp. P26]|nr:hypothetical protein LJK88_19470 [Paenibacillus sp. P26]